MSFFKGVKKRVAGALLSAGAVAALALPPALKPVGDIALEWARDKLDVEHSETRPEPEVTMKEHVCQVEIEESIQIIDGIENMTLHIKPK